MVLTTLRQRRYLGLFGVTLVIAIICVGAGTWQIARFHQKHDANAELRSNNRDGTVDVAAALGPASAPTATGKTGEYRLVTAAGRFLTEREVLVRGQTVGNDAGYLVLTPFQTSSGVLLVVRGFVSQTSAAADTPTVSAAPPGSQDITVRLEPSDRKPDRLGALPRNQVESIDPVSQARRLRQPVWNGYGELLAGQPGTANLTAIPNPDMSNPAGGAEEPQHAAYVVQWYLFAALALAMPFVLAAAERRRDSEDGESDKAGQQSQPQASNRRSKRAALDDRLAGKS
ncbi:MAG: hypothetical protein QOE71_156 [Pseudonocardiales bacterium]|nr:hypothetical protein [Pseudonocardiales bacterium]